MDDCTVRKTTGTRYTDLIPDWLDALRTMASQSEAFDSLNHGESHALILLSKSDSGLSAGALSETMGITTGRMANILRRLEEKGLVDRTVVPSNRRMASIELTEEGRDHAAALLDSMQQKAVAVLEALGRDDAETLIRILRKLAANATIDRRPDPNSSSSAPPASDSLIPNNPSASTHKP